MVLLQQHHINTTICVVCRLLQPRSGHLLMDTDRRPVANPPIRPHLFGDERFWRRVDVVMLAWQCRAVATQLRTVVSACPDALVCESPKPWRTAFAHRRLTPDGLQHLGMSSTDLRLQKPSHVLMLKNLKPSTPLRREADANRQLTLFMVFFWPSVLLSDV